MSLCSVSSSVIVNKPNYSLLTPYFPHLTTNKIVLCTFWARHHTVKASVFVSQKVSVSCKWKCSWFHSERMSRRTLRISDITMWNILWIRIAQYSHICLHIRVPFLFCLRFLTFLVYLVFCFLSFSLQLFFMLFLIFHHCIFLLALNIFLSGKFS
jgi:hypothetical protein